jgi:hypothetical protein
MRTLAIKRFQVDGFFDGRDRVKLKKALKNNGLFKFLAEWKGFEPSRRCRLHP